MEKPILFSTPMVKAILEGRKTQTRRIIKKQPVWDEDSGYKYWDNLMFDIHDDLLETMYMPDHSPYGEIGHNLWVRETFYAYGHWTLVTNVGEEPVKKQYHFNNLTLSEGKNYFYEDCPPATELICKGRFGLGYFKRPSIFMPKAACRTKLEITNITAERLQDISEEDAIAEGMILEEVKIDSLSLGWWYKFGDNVKRFEEAKMAYMALWDNINGKQSWDENPWVWVIEFKRLT
jgi:hypothetical protein